jgi:hypothetical protein
MLLILKRFLAFIHFNVQSRAQRNFAFSAVESDNVSLLPPRANTALPTFITL